MKTGARNFNTNRARNTGQSVRSNRIAKQELVKSVQVGNKAFYLDSKKLALHRFFATGRACTCMNYSSPDLETYEEDSNIDTPVIILGEDEGIEDDIALDKALELLEMPKDVCPICYGTSIVGNYVAVNSVELFLDASYPNKKMVDVDIREGRPFYFEPLSKNAKIIFTMRIPGFFESLQRFSYMPKATLHHQDVETSGILLGDKLNMEPFNVANIESYAQKGLIAISIPVTEPTLAFFMRFECGDPAVYVNFPNINAEIESGEHDYFSSITVSVDSLLRISTRDLLIDRSDGTIWRVTSIDKKEPMNIDLGKDITVRRVRHFEAYALIP